MFRSVLQRFLVCAALVGLLALAEGAAPVGAAEPADRVITIETDGSPGIAIRMAEELAGIVNEETTLRVVPVAGRGVLQDINDLMLPYGTDLAILPIDTVDFIRKAGAYPELQNSITYIAKLYGQEFHLLARPEIKSIADLSNRQVNENGGAAVVAARVFNVLNVRVWPTTYDVKEALAKLRGGEIAALAYLGAKPAPFLSDLKSAEGLHLLSVPADPKITAIYQPAELTEADYPGLVPRDKPVRTIGTGTAIYVGPLRPNSERYRKVAAFVDVFFTRFKELLAPGHQPKWREVDLTAEIPGWRRFPPADQWLRRGAAPETAAGEQDLKANFFRFLDARARAAGRPAMTDAEKDRLFDEYRRWRLGRAD